MEVCCRYAIGFCLFASAALLAQQPSITYNETADLSVVNSDLAPPPDLFNQLPPLPAPYVSKPVVARKPAPRQPTPLERAVLDFKQRTAELGVRADSGPQLRASLHSKPRWHGRLFENLRNDIFDAVPHEIVQRGGEKSLLRRNQYGFNVGGPVVIPKLYDGTRSTFFSLSYEAVRERIGRSYLRTVPTEGERTGDFSRTVDSAGALLPIYDPASTHANPNFDPSQPVSEGNLEYTRDPFPGNVIPAGRLDAKALGATALYPHPNASAGPFNRNNYFVVSPETNQAGGIILKLDHALNNHNRLEYSYSRSNGFAGAAHLFQSIADPSASDREFHSRHSTLQHVWTLSPKTVNTATFDYSTVNSQNISTAFPVYRFSPYLSTGKLNPFGRTVSNVFSYRESLSTKRGKHNVKLYAQFFRTQATNYADETPNGLFSFSAGLTSLPGIVNTGHAFGSFLLGLSDYGERTAVLSPSYFRRSQIAFGGREQYAITPTLNVVAALNVEVTTPRVEKYDRQSTVSLDAVNPATGQPGALITATDDARAFRPTIAVAEPSLSLTWSPGGSSKTVARLDVSRRYDAMPIGNGQFGTQAFNAALTYTSPNAQLAPALVLANGAPPLPALPNTRPDAVNDTVADYLDPTSHLPRINSASLQIEREVPGAMTLTVGVNHSDGKHMLAGNWAFDVNAIPLDALAYRDELNNQAFRQSLRPYPQYTGLELNGQYPEGRYKRDSGFLKVEKRSSSGLSLSATYEYVKQLDDYSGLGVQDYINHDNNWSLTPFLNPHRFFMSYVYELPFGPGKPLLNYGDWRKVIVEGWSLSGMTSLNGGDPLYLRPQFNNTGGVIKYLSVNTVAGVDPSVPDPSADLWFNPAAFAQPDDFTAGTMSRTHPSLRLPGSQNHDVSVTKRFPLDAERTVELSAVGFNFLNHANLSDPDLVIGPASAPNVNAGRIISTVGGRVVQLGLRYSF